MQIITSLLYGFGWLVIYGFGSFICASVIFRYTSKKSSSLDAVLTYGLGIGIMLSSIVIYLAHLVVGSLTISFWSTVILVGIIGYIVKSNLYNLLILIKKSSISSKRVWLWDLLIAVFFVTAFALLERFLPEYDGYIQERMSNLLVQLGHIDVLTTYYRPGFLYLISTAKLIDPILGLFYAKFFFPILFLVIVVRGCRLWLGNTSKPWIIWVIVFSSPLFISQAIYFRAQTMVVALFPLAAYAFFLQKERWLKFVFLVLSIFGIILFHIFFTFLLLFSIPFLYQEGKRILFAWSIREKVIFTILIAVIIYNLAPQLGSLQSNLSVYLTFSNFHFVPNPLSALTAGNRGLSGFSELLKFYLDQILYFLIPIGILVGITFKTVKTPSSTTNRYLWILVLAFFIATEVLPRIGFQYDPQRFWIFINLLLIMQGALLFSKLSSEWQRGMGILLTTFSLLSLSVVGYFVHARAKTFNTEDYNATVFISRTTPNALVIGPEVKFPGFAIYKGKDIRYFDSFPGIISYNNSSMLQNQLDWLSRMSSTSLQKNKLSLQNYDNTLSTYIDNSQTIPQSFIDDYADYISQSKEIQQPVLIYTCNNIVYCADTGYEYDPQIKQLSQDSFLKKVYQSSTITLFQYLPSKSSLAKPTNALLLETIFKTSVNRTEYGTNN